MDEERYSSEKFMDYFHKKFESLSLQVSYSNKVTVVAVAVSVIGAAAVGVLFDFGSFGRVFSLILACDFSVEYGSERRETIFGMVDI